MRLKFTRKRFLRNTRGVTAVEFAMVAPVFFMALGVVIEVGIMLFAEYVLQASVQDAARQIRTGQAQSAGASAAAFKTQICENAKAIIRCDGVRVYVRSAASFAALKTATPSYINIGQTYGGGAETTSYDCGGPSKPVAVIATYDWDIVMPFLGMFGNVDNDEKRRIAGFAMFQNEPFPAGSNCS